MFTGGLVGRRPGGRFLRPMRCPKEESSQKSIEQQKVFRGYSCYSFYMDETHKKIKWVKEQRDELRSTEKIVVNVFSQPKDSLSQLPLQQIVALKIIVVQQLFKLKFSRFQNVKLLNQWGTIMLIVCLWCQYEQQEHFSIFVHIWGPSNELIGSLIKVGDPSTKEHNNVLNWQKQMDCKSMLRKLLNNLFRSLTSVKILKNAIVQLNLNEKTRILFHVSFSCINIFSF